MTESIDNSNHQNLEPGSQNAGQLPLRIPEGIRYNCQGCGRCCTGYAVGLTEADYQRIKDVDWGSHYPQLAGKELFTHSEKEYAAGLSLYPHHTKTNEHGECSFLIDNLCSIHSTLGEPKKPGMCKLFPYTFVPTPSGIYVGVAMNSMAAVRNIGQLLSEQREQLEHTWHIAVQQERAQGASQQVASYADSITAENLASVQYDVNLVSGVPLSWDQYLLIEARIMRAIQSDEFPNIFHLFLAVTDILAEALRLKVSNADLTAINDFKPSVDRWLNEVPGVFENLVFNLIAFRNNEWTTLRKQYATEWATSTKSPLTQPTVIKAALRTVLQGKMFIPDLGIISLDKARNYKINAFEPEVDQFIRRYLYHKLFSKTFCGPAMSGLSMIAGFNNLAANFLSGITYAKAHALGRGEKQIKLADLYEAYFLMDKEMASLTQLPREKSQFYDNGFSSARLFCRLFGQISASVGNN
ncbi:MAG: YkgJ family cysteine cluster protein [Candidatus Melainabacteria bacterium]|nr:MAG: YkgJ family cysteine cluster protein [Candidatus Melainabacteria bacterium]